MHVKWTIFWCVHEYSFTVWLMIYLNVVRIKVQFLKRLPPLSCFHRDCRDRWKQHKLSGFATWLVALQSFCHNLQHSILIKDRRPSVTLTALYRKITNNGKDLKDKICPPHPHYAQPLKHTCICTLNMRNEGERNKVQAVVTTCCQPQPLHEVWGQKREDETLTKDGPFSQLLALFCRSPQWLKKTSN